tara:strand:- start:1058 stop:2728 length:1671 start_codon:yes stop_codon:yes gene_type:complete
MNSNLAPNSIPNVPWDVVVIGAGAAGLMTTLELPKDLKVLLLNRNTSKRSCSRWAQGGIAAVVRDEDSLDSHAEDTLRAGAGLCDGDAVRKFVENAPKCVERLLSLGMEFDRDSEQLATTLEAAHSFRRVLHVKDLTGRALVEVLLEQVDQSANIFHRRGIRVTQIWVENNRCCGVQVLDGPILRWIPARAVVLATGGGGHLFANTTNPAQACGEGIALAWRVGAIIEDLEFVQFHPTALSVPGAPSFLISEALRGEGAVLVDSLGNSPVENLLGADLATRDQVSRALFQSMKKQGSTHVGLDLKPIPRVHAEKRFPSILHRCRELGLDPLTDCIPVAPAAHYWMGGVATNLQAKTSVSGLYAVGEVACTGLHGANRLASNSLMECLVFSREMNSIQLNSSFPKVNTKYVSNQLKCNLKLSGIGGSEVLSLAIQNLRNLCWQEAGVNRSVKGMKRAFNAINKDYSQLIKQPLLEFVNDQDKNIQHLLTEESRRDLNLLLDLNHRQLTSSLLLESCLFRKESRGGHYRNDFPVKVPFWKCHTRHQLGRQIFTRPVNN